jgi:hypothetical protein
MAMTTSAIVKHLDVLPYVLRRQVAVLVNVFLDAFLLQAAEERFDHCIVPAVALAPHAGLEVMRPAEAAPRVAAVLRTLIGIDQCPARPPFAHGHEHRVEHELAAHRAARGPADDAAREEVDDHGQVEPALPHANVSHIRDPRLVASRDRELPLQEVRNEVSRFADRLSSRAIAMQRSEAVGTHQPRDPMLAARGSGLAKVEEDPRRSVNPLTRRVRRAYQPQQPSILKTALRDGLLKPVVVPALSDPEHATHHLNTSSCSP